MKIVSWNVYDEATQELRFIPEGSYSNSLVTNRLPETCIGEYYKNQIPYGNWATTVYDEVNKNKNNVNQSCILKWIQRGDHWQNVYHEYAQKLVTDDESHKWAPKCMPTPEDVSQMVWEGRSCVNVVPTEAVSNWTASRHNVIAEVVRQMLKSADVICLQEVSQDQYKKLKPLSGNCKIIADWDKSDAKKDRRKTCQWHRSNVIMYDQHKYKLIKYATRYTDATHCMQFCTLLNKKNKMRATVVNVHFYVPRDGKQVNGKILEAMADRLKTRFQQDAFLVIVGDMNMRLSSTSTQKNAYSPSPHLWSGSVSHELDHAFVQAREAKSIKVNNDSEKVLAEMRRIIENTNAIEMGLQKDTEEMQTWWGPGQIDEVDEYKHWVSDHDPLALTITASITNSQQKRMLHGHKTTSRRKMKTLIKNMKKLRI